jgi:hypothetical protein
MTQALFFRRERFDCATDEIFVISMFSYFKRDFSSLKLHR